MLPSSQKTLPREKRIRKRRDYLRIQRFGARSFGRFIIAIAQRAKDGSHGQIGITVPKKVGDAHVRNLVKRRIKHVLRHHQKFFLERYLVIVARDVANKASFSELESDLLDACRRLRVEKNYTRPRHSPSKIA